MQGLIIPKLQPRSTKCRGEHAFSGWPIPQTVASRRDLSTSQHSVYINNSALSNVYRVLSLMLQHSLRAFWSPALEDLRDQKYHVPFPNAASFQALRFRPFASLDLQTPTSSKPHSPAFIHKALQNLGACSSYCSCKRFLDHL